MNVFSAQLILAASRNDDENSGWIQLLVFVVMAVLWAVGGIIKAKSKKQNPEDDEQLEKTLTHRKRAGQRPGWQIQSEPIKPQKPQYEEPELIAQKEPVIASKPLIKPESSFAELLVSAPLEDAELLLGGPLKGIDINVYENVLYLIICQ